MAAGDINSRTVANFGNQKIVYGTIEVDDGADTFAIADTSSTILWCQVTNMDGVGAIRCMINSSDGTEGTALGSIYCDNSVAETSTVSYLAAISA